MSAPEQSGPSAIARLLRPHSVAVVGASSDATKTAGRPVAYLQKHGFGGQIWPVNPRAKEIAGLQCYADVAALPGAPDVGIVLVGPERVAQAVRELAELGTTAAIVLAGGYGETGEDGARRQRELKQAAGKMRLLGPNTIGLVNLVDHIMLSASNALEVGDLPAGGISVVSQSGGLLGSLLSRAADRGVGFAHLVSTGNEADIDAAEMIDYFVDDEATRVIALYLEGMRHPAAFRRAALRAAERGKPIVAYKVGRSEGGARAAMSHTGALAGSERTHDALFRQLGIIRAELFTDLIDIPAGLACGRKLKGKRLGVLTTTGGAGTLIADFCGMKGLELPDPEPATVARLTALLDDEQAAADRNPVDMTLAGVKPDVYRGAIDALAGSTSYDGVVVIVGSSALANPTLAADAIVECQERTEKPIVAFLSPHAPHIVRMLNIRGIPAFATPEGTAAALDGMRRSAGRPAGAAPIGDLSSGPSAGLQDLTLSSGPLNEAESKALFARFGVPTVREIATRTGEEAEAAARELGDKVVVKILARHIAHKSDVGGVRVGVAPSDVQAVCISMRARLLSAGLAAPEGFLVQEMVTEGLEMILGFHRDPQLGLAVLLGMGGVAAELVGDTSLRLLPIARADAEDMISELRTAKLLDGYRGAPRRDVPALVEAILSFARMAEALGDRLVEAEINPLLVLPEGRGVCAVDGLAVLT